MGVTTQIQDPFGQADCESEVRRLKDEYSRIFFDDTPFNAKAIESQAYLIVGRRGSGKTALARYFSFQKAIENPVYVDIDEPLVYQRVLTEIANRASESKEIAIPSLKKLWDYILWTVMARETIGEPHPVAGAGRGGLSVSHYINRVIEALLRLLREPRPEPVSLEQTTEITETIKASILRIARKTPLIVAVDTLERYDTNDDALMNAMAALIQSAEGFNADYSSRGIHIKVFMSGEVFPYLREEVMPNTLKSIRHEVHLLWRPKDLLRLITWRFYCYMKERGRLLRESEGNIDWQSHREVMDRMWRPYFGHELVNGRGLKERTLSYVLRHTQMRPRQLIVLCNSIASRAAAAGRFPQFSEDDIRSGVKDSEVTLASEIINSFSLVYPHLSSIVDALMRIPMVFPGKELDRRASQSASAWPERYTKDRFRRLVAELGIVGRVRRRNDAAGYIDADFEYSLEDRLPLAHQDECVIHPMFFRRLNVQFNCPGRVMPFSTEREAQEADGNI